MLSPVDPGQNLLLTPVGQSSDPDESRFREESLEKFLPIQTVQIGPSFPVKAFELQQSCLPDGTRVVLLQQPAGNLPTFPFVDGRRD